MYTQVHTEEDAQELELQMVANHPIWMLGTEMGPVHEQQELLSDEPS